MSERDRDLGMNRRIAHRDFLNGVAIRVGGALATCGFPGLEWIAKAAEEHFAQDKTGYYPPTLSARDIEAIIVNRWPHGYAYEYNPLWDPDWPAGQRPCEIARVRFGRITIANSDAAAAAYTDQAMDQGYRAVHELLSL